MRTGLVIALGVFGLSVHSVAQIQTWQVILVSNDTLFDCSLQSVQDSITEWHCGSGSALVHLDSIVAVRRYEESHFWPSGAYGAFVGLGVGAALGAAAVREGSLDPSPVVFGAIVGTGAGCIIGGLLGGIEVDEVYTLAGKRRMVKLQILQNLPHL
jgi:hypothetical protein